MDPLIAYDSTYTIRVISAIDDNIYDESDLFTLSEATGTESSVNDVNGNLYTTIKIGKQWWISQNMKATNYDVVTSLINGTSVGDITGNYTTKYFFIYDITYGLLYTWAAAMNGASSSNSNPSNVRGVCPEGWHIPSDKEWKKLEKYF